MEDQLKNIAEKNIKELLSSYFILFDEPTLLDNCEKIGISTRRVPKSYIDYAKFYQKIPDKNLKSTSLFKNVISEEIEIFPHILEDIYILNLQIVPKTFVWNNEIFKAFGKQEKEIKEIISKLFTMVHYIFATLKKNNDILETISMVGDPKNITLKLHDILAPKYDHDFRIGIYFEKKSITNK